MDLHEDIVVYLYKYTNHDEYSSFAISTYIKNVYI